MDETTASPTPFRHRGRLIVLLLALLLVMGGMGFGVFLDQYGQQERARPAQAILVLGSRILANHQAGDSLRARVRKGVALYRQGLAPMIICTGGAGTFHPPTEAEAARALLLHAGVPARDIVMETTSTSTRENIANAAAICRAHGWTRVIVVSDPYHLWRAQRDCTLAGLTAYPSPARDCARNRIWYRRIQWTAREVVAIVRDVVLGK